MALLKAILGLSGCIYIQAARNKISDDTEILGRIQQDEFVEVHKPKHPSNKTCTEFDAEVKRLNLSVPTGLGLALVCAEWPVDKWGPFPNMSTTKAIEDFVKDAGDYYEKFKALANTTDKTFCWKHVGYATKVADAIECPAKFNPKQLGSHELEMSTEIKPDWAGYCTKTCDQMCGPNSESSMIFWCKCPVNETTVTVPNRIRRNKVKCPTTVGNDTVMKWGSGCFASCPAGTNRLSKLLPFCDTDCHMHNEFNTSCGWGCAKDKRSCADSTEKMTVYGLAAALDVMSIGTGQFEAIPMIYTLVGLVNTLYEIIEKVVSAIKEEHASVKGLPFLAAASKFVDDLQNKDAKQTMADAKDLTKKIVAIIVDIYQLVTSGKHNKLGPISILKKLFGKYHLKTFLSIYETFEAFHKPLCPYSTDAPPMESTVNYDGAAPNANIE